MSYYSQPPTFNPTEGIHYHMIPPPPTDPPAYDLSLIALPTLEPMEKPRNERSTRRLGLPERMASLWCRVNGEDHGKWLRRELDRIIERIRGGNHG